MKFSCTNLSLLFSTIYIFKHLFISVGNFLLWLIIHNILFVAYVVLNLVIGGSFCWLLCPFDIFPSLSILLPTLLPDITGCSRFITSLLCRALWINHFSEEPWFFLLEKTIRNQHLRIKCAHCSEVSLFLWFSRERGREIYVCR